jgi:tetraacyldisaccharide-1-P 4'-kinase
VRLADALLVSQASPAEAAALAARWEVAHAFSVTRSRSVPRLVSPWGQPLRLGRDAPVVAVSGIAQPAAFFAELEQDGWTLTARVAFGDHRDFTARDLARIVRIVRETGAAAVLTTEKDAVRLLPWRPLPVPVAFVPLVAAIEPADVFGTWLLAALARARSGRGQGA